MAQAQQILAATPEYSDLTMSNYLEAYEWIVQTGLIEEELDESYLRVRILAAAIGQDESGLIDVDPDGIPGPGFLPAPVLTASRLLRITDEDAWEACVSANHKIDLERRARVGALGEAAVCRLLEEAGCETYQGSLDSDALGWDVRTSYRSVTKHLEVKSTTSLARLRIFLSRHEYEVSVVDSRWLLAIALISEDGGLKRFAHLKTDVLARAVPVDRPGTGKWQSCSVDLDSTNLVAGFPLNCPDLPGDGVYASDADPMWWPTSSPELHGIQI